MNESPRLTIHGPAAGGVVDEADGLVVRDGEEVAAGNSSTSNNSEGWAPSIGGPTLQALSKIRAPAAAAILSKPAAVAAVRSGGRTAAQGE